MALLVRLGKPDPVLSDFIEGFWMVEVTSNTAEEVVILPDGSIDVVLLQSDQEPFHVSLNGLSLEPAKVSIPPNAVIYAISFRVLATEYILHTSVAHLRNSVQRLPPDFWGFSAEDLSDFETFCVKASKRIISRLPTHIDNRKQKLLRLIHESNGTLSVHELAEQGGWSSRQINRYFNHQVGVSLKTYCRIIRFRASFEHLKEGKLFPQQAFADQAHFIREIKKFSGVVPKELSKNRNDRFVQLLAPPTQ